MEKNTENEEGIFCYICGKKYQISLLQSHITSCKTKYERKNHTTIFLPQEYEDLLDDYKFGLKPNLEEINKKLQKKSLKYEKEHLKQDKNFKEYLNTISESKKPNEDLRKKGEKPRIIKCPLCGNQFSYLSLKIHIKRCKEKMIQSQYYLPSCLKSDVESICDRVLNVVNQGNLKQKIQTNGIYDIEKLDNDAFENFDLVECYNCGRKFKKDRLKVHQNICFKHPEMFIKK